LVASKAQSCASGMHRLDRSVKTRDEVLRIFRQFLEFAAYADSQQQVIFDKYHNVLNAAHLRVEEGELVLKFDIPKTFARYDQIIDERFGHPPHPELWDEAHGGYFQEGVALEHPERLQVYSLGMIFGKILLGSWLLDFPTYMMPVYDQGFDFERFQPHSGAAAKEEKETKPPASDQAAFLKFARSRLSARTDFSTSVLSKEIIEEVLADEGFMSVWWSMLQYKSVDRPAAAELSTSSAFKENLVVLTLFPPPPPLNEDSAVACIGMDGAQVASCKLSMHATLATVRVAVAEKLGLQTEALTFLSPNAQLLTALHDKLPLVDCLQITSP